MNVGDLVKKQNPWAEWVQYNPWMALRADDMVGIVVGVHEGSWPHDYDLSRPDAMYVSRRVDVLWPTGFEKSLPETKLILVEMKVIKSKSTK